MKRILSLIIFIVSFRLYAAHTQDDCFLILNNPSLYPLHQINDCSKRLSEEDRLREKGFIKCLYSHCTKTCLFGWIKHESGCYTCECASINENSLFEGDIKVAGVMNEYLENVLENPQRKNNTNTSLDLPIWNIYKTDNLNVIPYIIDSSIGIKGRLVINEALQEFKAQKLCLKFKVRSDEDNYLTFFDGGICYSSVGAVKQQQLISLGRGCQIKGIVIHLIMHSLGFWHEQSRDDRDQHIKVHFENIQYDMGYNFNKQIIKSIGEYDVKSIMHGTSFEYSSNGKPTITDLYGNVLKTQRQGLSFEDVQKINALYQCDVKGIQTQKMSENCQSLDNFCDELHRLGACQYFPRFMLENCSKICGVEYRTCEDKNILCYSWMLQGFCLHFKYIPFMHLNCRRSCNLCRI